MTVCKALLADSISLLQCMKWLFAKPFWKWFAKILHSIIDNFLSKVDNQPMKEIKVNFFAIEICYILRELLSFLILQIFK